MSVDIVKLIAAEGSLPLWGNIFIPTSHTSFFKKIYFEKPIIVG